VRDNWLTEIWAEAIEAFRDGNCPENWPETDACTEKETDNTAGEHSESTDSGVARISGLEGVGDGCCTASVGEPSIFSARLVTLG